MTLQVSAPVDVDDDEPVAFGSCWALDRLGDAAADRVASHRVWGAYLKSSHARGIGVELDEHAVSRAKRLKREAAIEDDEDEAEVADEENSMSIEHDKILKAVSDGISDRASIAKAVGMETVKAGYYIKALVDEKKILATGATNSRRYYPPGTVFADKEKQASAPRAKVERAPKARPGKLPPASEKPRTRAMYEAKPRGALARAVADTIAETSALDAMLAVRDPAMVVRFLGVEVQCSNVEQVIALARAAAQS